MQAHSRLPCELLLFFGQGRQLSSDMEGTDWYMPSSHAIPKGKYYGLLCISKILILELYNVYIMSATCTSTTVTIRSTLQLLTTASHTT